MDNLVAVSALSQKRIKEALNLAKKLDLEYLSAEDSEKTKKYRYLLALTEDYIGLIDLHLKKAKHFYIDFLSAKMWYRLTRATLKNENLAKALGAKPHENPTIIDATAGLGRDSMILAKLGFKVTMIERSSILCVLLKDALNRAIKNPLLGSKVANLDLKNVDAKDWLPKEPGKKPDIIYLDPMFPKREKSASVKKEMIILKNLLGYDENVQDLFNIALSCAAKRVVVKRPRLAPQLKGAKPNYSLKGSSSRFDIYLV